MGRDGLDGADDTPAPRPGASTLRDPRPGAILPGMHTRHALPSAAALLFAAASLAAPAPPLPQFSGETPLAALNLAMPAMRGAKQVPAKPVPVGTYTWTRGDGTTWQDERSPAVELWRAAQSAGTWADRAGNELTIARAQFAFPALPYEHASREEFDEALADPALRLSPRAEPAALADWVARFAGVEVRGAPAALPLNRQRLSALWEIPLADPAARAYAFRFDPNHAGQAAAQAAWFVAVFRVPAAAADPGAADRQLRNNFLAAVRALGRFSGAAPDPKARPRARPDAEIPEDARRAAAHATIELLDDWWHMDSPHYVVLSDTTGDGKSADRLLGVLEALRPRYAALVPSFPEAEEPTSVVRFFRGDDEFVRYFEGTPLALTVENTAGFYDGWRRELVIRPARKEWGGPEYMEATVRHEGFHQWLHAAWPGADAPTWFNEGTAELFESYVPRGAGGSFEWREQESQARWLETLARSRDADWTALLRATLLADQAAFYNPPHFGGEAWRSYAFAYGLLYFLHRGAPLVRNQPWKDVLPTLYRSLHESPRDPRGATCAAFRMGPDGADTAFLEAFAADLRAFWRSSSARQNARNAKLP